MNQSGGSPWRFLTPLDGEAVADRALIQLTRQDELRIVTDMVTASKASILYAMSGNGKTSLLDAGLIPAVESKGWLVVRTRPRPPWSLSDPVRAFKDCMVRALRLPLFGARDLALLDEARAELDLVGSAGDTERVRQILQTIESKIRRLQASEPEPLSLRDHLRGRMDLRLREFVGELMHAAGKGTRLLVICDQFEELFVHYGNTDAMNDFAEQIGDLWADDVLDAHLLFSMREDWVGSMIELRRAIPPIFTNYFKLDPLRRAAAAHVLTHPLRGTLYRFADEAVCAILTDLALAYLEHRVPDARPSKTLAAAEEAFVELPAVHIVAERMWQTRGDHDPPFTLAHYEGLVPATVDQAIGDTRTPAARVLDDYLIRQLGDEGRRAQGDAEQLEFYVKFTAGERRDLRLDCLVLLTDEVAHRRALSEPLLLSQLRRLRPGGLSLPEVDAAVVRDALAPLNARRVVRALEDSEAQPHYELSHDFAVRAVVRAWRQLEQRRVGERALRRRAEEARERQLVTFAATDRRIGRFLQVVPLLATALWLGFAASQVFVAMRITHLMYAVGLVGGLVGIRAVAGVVAALARDRWSMSAALVVILIFGGGLWFCELAAPWGDLHYSVRRSWLMLLCASAAMLVELPAVRRIERRLGPQDGRDRMWAIAQAEVVDMLAWVAVASGLVVAERFISSGLIFGIFFVPILSAWQVKAWGTTPGGALLGLRLSRVEGVETPGWPRALWRQGLFIVWTAVSVASMGLVWLLVCVVGVARRQERAWYDVLSRVKIGAGTPWLFTVKVDPDQIRRARVDVIPEERQ